MTFMCVVSCDVSIERLMKMNVRHHYIRYAFIAYCTHHDTIIYESVKIVMVVSLLTAYGVILRYGDDYVHNPLFHTAEFEIMLTCSL